MRANARGKDSSVGLDGHDLGMGHLAGEEHRQVIHGRGMLLMFEKSSSDGGRPAPCPWEVYVQEEDGADKHANCIQEHLGTNCMA